MFCKTSNCIIVAKSLQACTDSSDCPTGEFCEFDSSNSGLCKSCDYLQGSCESQSFNLERTKQECKSQCEGK